MNAFVSRVLALAVCAALFALPAYGLPPLSDAAPYETGPLEEPRVLDVVDEADLLEQASPPPNDADKKKKAAALKKKEALKKAVASAYAPVFYDNNFDYLCNPLYCDWHAGEHLKRICVHDSLIVDIGGQYRMRWHTENNIRGLGYTGRDDDFLLNRLDRK